MTCVQPLGLSMWRSFSFKQPPPPGFKHLPCAQSRARLRFRKSVFPERSLTEFRIARAVPYGTPKSLTEFLPSGFAAEIPGRKSLGIPIDDTIAIRNRFGNSHRDTDSIRNWQFPPQNHCGKQSGRLPGPNLPSFLGDILPFANTKKSDEANAKPPH